MVRPGNSVNENGTLSRMKIPSVDPQYDMLKFRQQQLRNGTSGGGPRSNVKPQTASHHVLEAHLKQIGQSKELVRRRQTNDHYQKAEFIKKIRQMEQDDRERRRYQSGGGGGGHQGLQTIASNKNLRMSTLSKLNDRILDSNNSR